MIATFRDENGIGVSMSGTSETLQQEFISIISSFIQTQQIPNQHKLNCILTAYVLQNKEEDLLEYMRHIDKSIIELIRNYFK